MTDPKVTFRIPKKMLREVDDLADRHGVSRSSLLRRFVAFGMESNAEAISMDARIEKLRDEIIEFGSPIDDAGGFAGRVADDFEKRFKNRYKPKWLAAKAESYRREARMLEEEVPEHPDAPPIEDGEFLEEVERVLDETLEAAQLSDWTDRYDNRLERLSGVREGKEGRRFALVLTRNAIEMDNDLGYFREEIDTGRRVQPDDLPDLAESELPPNVDREDVARVARELADRGVEPDDVELDPTEFNPFGWMEDGDPSELPGAEADATEVVSDSSESETEVAIEPGAETDGGAVADGGGDESILVYNQNDEDAEDAEQSDEQPDADTSNMDRDNPIPDRSEIVNGLAEQYDKFGGGRQAEKFLYDALENPNVVDENNYQRGMRFHDLDKRAVVEDAIDRADTDAPEAGA